ncbi:MAG: hypothetical protein H6536_06490 [Bacteroidales bacterium]|nr:hypothetical protein [Bacteroidales bacterium]
MSFNRLMDVSRVTGSSIVDRIAFYKMVHSERLDPQNLIFILYNASVVRLKAADFHDIDIFKGRAMLLFVERGKVLVADGDAVSLEFVDSSIVNTWRFSPQAKLRIAEESVIHYIDMNWLVDSMYDNEHLVQYLESI